MWTGVGLPPIMIAVRVRLARAAASDWGSVECEGSGRVFASVSRRCASASSVLPSMTTGGPVIRRFTALGSANAAATKDASARSRMLRLLACFTDSDTWRRLPSMTTAALSITQIENTHLVRCGHANWVLVEEGSDLTLIDGGYPANGTDVERSIEQIGHQLGDVRAILVTHAHIDHIGGIADIVTRLEVPVLMDPLEVPHAKREYLQQLSPAGVPLLLWRRGAPKWLRDVIGVGALKGAELPRAQSFASGGALDVPGRIVPIPTHGHTDGHSAYLVPDAGVIASGDALVTGHATSSVAGPQFLVCPFNHDREATDQALDNIAGAPAGVLFPGHGPVYEGSMTAAVEQARAGRTRMRP